MKIQQIPHIATTGEHNYAGREQDPHQYHKTLQNPTKIKKNTKYIMIVMLLVMVSLL